jgi:uncharacterized protein YggT (Ycf19 family)
MHVVSLVLIVRYSSLIVAIVFIQSLLMDDNTKSDNWIDPIVSALTNLNRHIIAQNCKQDHGTPP